MTVTVVYNIRILSATNRNLEIFCNDVLPSSEITCYLKINLTVVDSEERK